MFTENCIVIKGKSERVFEVAGDILKWPEILPHYRRVRLIANEGFGRVVEMAADRDGIPVRWVSIQELQPEEKKIIFRHIGGFTKGMYVEWNLRQEADYVHVRIIHNFELPWPIIGPVIAQFVVGRFFVHNIAGKTLARIKEIIEAEGGHEKTQGRNNRNRGDKPGRARGGRPLGRN